MQGFAEITLGRGRPTGRLEWYSPPDAPGCDGPQAHVIQKALRAFVAVLDKFGATYYIKAQVDNWHLGTWDSGKQFKENEGPNGLFVPPDSPMVQLDPRCCEVFTRNSEALDRAVTAMSKGIALRMPARRGFGVPKKKKARRK